MQTTKVFSDLLAAYLDPAVRIIALQGGTRSSKTYSTLQLLDYIGRRSKKKRLISTVSETMPHLKRGAIRDFQNMLGDDYQRSRWHDTDKIYTYGKGALEFFSAMDADKVRGPARDVLFINECNNVDYEVARQLFIRTTEKIILDFNPVAEFWLDEKLVPTRKDLRIIKSTYLDNDMLSAAQIAEIESNRDIDPDWWRVYGLGERGSTEGLIWKNWDIVDSMPRVRKEQYIGIDWGWSNPTAVMHIVLGEGGEVWIDQLLHAPNVENPDIIKAIRDAGLAHLEIIADPAEPKSIKELRNAGLNVAEHGISKDVNLGIRVVNRYKKHYTARSLETIRENRNYKYQRNKNGDYTDAPVKKHDHSKDAERYVFLNRLSNIQTGFDVVVSRARKK